MLGILSKIFGGNKSEKDIKHIQPLVEQVNQHFAAYQSLSNDQLRGKTQEFRGRIKEHLNKLDTRIADLNRQAEELPFSDITGKDVIYQEVDELKKERDEQIEEVLETLLPEAFAVVKETSRRFKENAEIEATATELDRDLSVNDLARRAFMAPRTFARRFRASTGSTPLQWLLHQRVALAQRLLETTDLPIDVVARQAGFGSAPSLRQHFGRVVGTSPHAYRSRLRRAS